MNVKPHVRNEDPETSHLAAAGKKDNKAAALVLESLTHSEIPLIDEEIASDVYKRHPLYAPSPDRLRHGRKSLLLAGLIMQDGYGDTKRGCKAQAWRLK